MRCSLWSSVLVMMPLNWGIAARRSSGIYKPYPAVSALRGRVIGMVPVPSPPPPETRLRSGCRVARYRLVFLGVVGFRLVGVLLAAAGPPLWRIMSAVFLDMVTGPAESPVGHVLLDVALPVLFLELDGVLSTDGILPSRCLRGRHRSFVGTVCGWDGGRVIGHRLPPLKGGCFLRQAISRRIPADIHSGGSACYGAASYVRRD